MTKIEALARLKYIAREDDSRITTADIMALEMAIQALSQEPCDGAISRKDVINAIDKWISEYKPQHYLIQNIRDLPSVTQKSKWILDETDNSITCDICGCLIWANDISNGDAHYCPNCGARMVEPRERSE